MSRDLRNSVAVFFIFALGLVYLWVTQKYFGGVRGLIDSNFFFATVTVLVGGFAIYLYWAKRRDEKRDAAKLILQEIRYAEQKIREAKRKGGDDYFLEFRVLPTNSWDKNRHLFSNDLETDAIDAITRFYSQAGYIDYLIRKIGDFKVMRQDIIEEEIINKDALAFLGDDSEAQELYKVMNHDDKKKALTRLVLERPQTRELAANGSLRRITESVEFIYFSTAVERLKEIAKIKR